MPGSVIVGGARTPIGKLSGALKSFTAMDLGGFAISAALERSGISGDQVDYVIMGHVIQAGAGQITARQAAVKGGIPMDVPALTVNKVCLSGLNAIAMADQLISIGEFDVVVAGGMESMTNGPYLLPGARAGYRYGDNKIVDATSHDALYCAFDLRGMGDSTEFYSKQKALTREDQDAYSAQSHERAITARKNGLFDDEIVNVTVPQRRGDPLTVTDDEGVREGTTAASLAKLRPAFSADGTVTAGSASQISDGAAAVVVMSRAKAEELGAPVLAEIGAHGVVAGPDPSLLSQPSNAILKALGKEGKTPADVDLFEINEAFAAVALQSMRDLDIDRRERQRQRRRHLDGPPRRRVRGAGGAASGAGTGSPRRRSGRRRVVRRRRPGRGPAPARRLLTGGREPGLMNGAPMKVLVVEDEAAAARVLVEEVAGPRLRGRRSHTQRCRGAPQDRLRRQVSISILLDIQLPDISGMDVLRRLRAAGCDVDVMTVTVMRRPVDTADGYGPGCRALPAQTVHRSDRSAEARALPDLPRGPPRRRRPPRRPAGDRRGLHRAAGDGRRPSPERHRARSRCMPWPRSCGSRGRCRPRRSPRSWARRASQRGATWSTSRSPALAKRSSRYGRTGRPEVEYRWSGDDA